MGPCTREKYEALMHVQRNYYAATLLILLGLMLYRERTFRASWFFKLPFQPTLDFVEDAKLWIEGNHN